MCFRGAATAATVTGTTATVATFARDSNSNSSIIVAQYWYSISTAVVGQYVETWQHEKLELNMIDSVDVMMVVLRLDDTADSCLAVALAAVLLPLLVS